MNFADGALRYSATAAADIGALQIFHGAACFPRREILT